MNIEYYKEFNEWIYNIYLKDINYIIFNNLQYACKFTFRLEDTIKSIINHVNNIYSLINSNIPLSYNNKDFEDALIKLKKEYKILDSREKQYIYTYIIQL